MEAYWRGLLVKEIEGNESQTLWLDLCLNKAYRLVYNDSAHQFLVKILFKNKIAKGFGIILRARKFFNKKILLNLYHAFIFPYLIYCVEMWGNAANIYLDPLIKLQKKIIRVITFSQYLAHTNDLFVQLQILPFKKLVIHRIELQMFKNNLGYILKAVESLFITNSDIHKYNTRNKDKMRAAYGK